VTGPAAAGGADTGWQRLHPLSPVVRAGRGAIGLLVVVVLPLAGGGGSTRNDLGHLAGLALVLVLGLVSWLVTRWRIEGGVLRIDSGLLRRTSDRLPVSQIQAVDVVRPGLARIFRLAELRIRLAGGGGRTGRLAYLPDEDAERVRARLLALAHGVAEDAPAPPERPLLVVPPGRLVGSSVLSGPGLAVLGVLVVWVVLAETTPRVAGGVIGASLAVFVGLVIALGRRVNAHYRLTVAEAPDGLRVRGGLVETSAETIPRGRVQAVRMVEPLLWRPLGWCRLEVDVAGQKSRGRQDRNAARSQRDLLPVGTRADADLLLAVVLAAPALPRTSPPARARWKSPLRFRHLSWGGDGRLAVTTSGRLRRVTDWVPLDKVQSIRRAQGPVQRWLGLADVHLDTAGRRVHAVARDRDGAECDRILAELPDRCRDARARASAAAPRPRPTART
jgi:putative membrane protein